MTSRTRNLAFAAGTVFFLVFLWWAFLEPGDAGGTSTTSSPASPLVNGAEGGDAIDATTPQPDEGAAPVESGTPALADGDLTTSPARRTYAIALHELEGLSPDVAPGTRIELWVAWDPSISEGPDIRPLLKDVIIEKLIPPVVPEGAVDVLLSVPMKGISDLFYGDRFGAFHVAMIN